MENAFYWWNYSTCGHHKYSTLMEYLQYCVIQRLPMVDKIKNQKIRRYCTKTFVRKCFMKLLFWRYYLISFSQKNFWRDPISSKSTEIKPVTLLRQELFSGEFSKTVQHNYLSQNKLFLQKVEKRFRYFFKCRIWSDLILLRFLLNIHGWRAWSKTVFRKFLFMCDNYILQQ